LDYAEINTIRSQFQAGQWPQFLQMVSIDGLRGENGSGKSTLLKAATCVYDQENKDKKFYPSAFFVDTHWDSIKGVSLVYRVKRGQSIDSFRVSKPTKRWRDPDNPPKRNVYLLDISRTLPLDASAGYAKIARLAAAEIESDEIDDEFRSRLSHVLGRTYQKARFLLRLMLIGAGRSVCFNVNGERYLSSTRVLVKMQLLICSELFKTFHRTPFL
jgi:energy-coupling factor transporter ATP-binding protein EcfA2